MAGMLHFNFGVRWPFGQGAVGLVDSRWADAAWPGGVGVDVDVGGSSVLMCGFSVDASS
jgi:hypothetical protein